MEKQINPLYLRVNYFQTIKIKNMNKAQLIDAMAEKAGLTKADAKKALDAFINVTTDALKADDRVALVGFGSFALSKREARTGRNPQTGKKRLKKGRYNLLFLWKKFSNLSIFR